jgi:hypothetical protein
MMIIAATISICMKPPAIWNAKNPSNQSMNKITAIVTSILTS